MRICNLASGSKANSTLVSYNDMNILVDVGLSEKKTKEQLESLGVKIEDIYAVIITHEHSDHIASLPAFAKKYDMNFYVHEELANLPLIKEIKFKEGKFHTFSDDKFNIGDLEINPFKISHDATYPVGFVINVFNSKAKVGFVTDTGVVLESMKKALCGVKLVFIESNYDEQMLLGGTYPYIIKKRIYGNKGHLSNVQSLELAKFLFENGTRFFVLSHISQNNNTPELALLNYLDYFSQFDNDKNKKVSVKMSFQDRHGNNYILKEEF